MAKTPGTPKTKTDAPAQFDMNSRDRKGGGKGGRNGPGRGRDEKRPPSHVISLPPTTVDRGEGWIIQKLGKVDQASHAPVGAEYHVVFEGHDPLVFGFLSAARERAKEPPPEAPKAPEPVAAAGDTDAPETGGEAGGEATEASTEASTEAGPDGTESKAPDAGA